MKLQGHVKEWADEHSDLLVITGILLFVILLSPLIISLFKTYYEEDEPEYDHITELYLNEVDLCEIIINRYIAVWKKAEITNSYIICNLDSSQLVRLYNKPVYYEMPDSCVKDTILVQDSKQALQYEYNILNENKLYKKYVSQKHEIDKEYKLLKHVGWFSAPKDERLESINKLVNELFMLAANPNGDILYYSNKSTLLISSIRWEIIVRERNKKIKGYKAIRMVERN